MANEPKNQVPLATNLIPLLVSILLNALCQT
jgi:hypothetical protein